MAKPDYPQLAADIIAGAGGSNNIATATHCATRLRLTLKDKSKASKKTVEAIPGVLSVVEAGGQFQVVIGNDVPIVYEAVTRLPGMNNGQADAGEDSREKKNLFDQFIAMISSIFLPFLWTLAGIGLLKAFISLATNLNWLSTESTTYVILYATADAVFYFLPIFLAITAAKRFKADQFTAVAIAGAMVYPTIIELYNAGEPVQFFGIPVQMMSYTSSVIPIIFAVWIQGYLERFLRRVLPSAIRNFTVPLLSAFVMVPLTLIVVGPITNTAATWISSGVMWVFGIAPWLAGAIMGGLWQVFVIFGLHWGFVPIMMNDLATVSYSLLLGPLVAAVVAQAAAALAVAIRTRSKARRQVAAPGVVSGFLAGITEPIIYGVNLPMRRPFYFGLAGGAVGGAIAAIGGSAADSFIMPSLLALPAYMNVGNFSMQIIGVLVAIGVAFVLTFFFGVTKDNDKPDATASDDTTRAGKDVASSVITSGQDSDTAVKTGVIETLGAPVSGTLVDVSEVADKVFASGALGSGIGIIPASSTVVAPLSGTLVTAFPTGHAYGIKSDNGVEVLIHIGIDTVALKGDGFNAHVTAGQKVAKGDTLATVDFEKVTSAGYDPTTIAVVTNTKKLASVTARPDGPVNAGDDAVTVEI